MECQHLLAVGIFLYTILHSIDLIILAVGYIKLLIRRCILWAKLLQINMVRTLSRVKRRKRPIKRIRSTSKNDVAITTASMATPKTKTAAVEASTTGTGTGTGTETTKSTMVTAPSPDTKPFINDCYYFTNGLNTIIERWKQKRNKQSNK